MIKTAILAILILVVIICGGYSLQSVNKRMAKVENSPTISSDKNKEPHSSLSDYCEKWDFTYKLLSENRKKTLQEEGVIYASDSNSENGYYILSQELVSDCEQRVMIGQLLWKVQMGIDTLADKNFALQNSKDIVRILRHIWNSPEFSSDGTHQAKYNLLVYTGIKDNDLALIMSDLVKTKIINLGLLNTLVERPLPSLKSVIFDSLKQSEKESDLAQQICYLIILQQISPSTKYLFKLNQLTHSSDLQEETKIALANIIQDLKLGAKIKSENLEKLPIIDQEEDKNITEIRNTNLSRL